MEETRTATMETIVERDNMLAALSKVKANKGAPGVDRMGVGKMTDHLCEHWGSIKAKLLAGEYRPAAVLATDIPKASGGERHLGIPTVIDRMLQQAILQVMTPLFDGEFSPSSYGYRPGRSAHQAVRAGREYVVSGKHWIVEIDLQNFFDQVNHDRLMTMVGRKVRDKRLLGLIGGYLRAPLQHADGKREKRTAGTPQGGPLSPFLANIYLDPLDQELESRGVSFVRYADDITIFASSERSAHRILASVCSWLEKNLGLAVNRDKSGVGPSSSCCVLGFRLFEDGRIGVAPERIKRLKRRVRQCFNARRPRTIHELRREWGQYINGWWNYYRIADWRREVERLSGWIRRHMRKYFWLRWHSPRGRLNGLRRHGVKGRGLGMAYCSRGAWAIARHVTLQQALKTRKLTQGGFGIPWELASARK